VHKPDSGADDLGMESDSRVRRPGLEQVGFDKNCSPGFTSRPMPPGRSTALLAAIYVLSLS